jgi:hypothetical protein
MPNYPCEFELPDEWMAEAGMVGFVPKAAAYHSTAEAVAVPLREIEPPYRVRAYPMDWCGFDRSRFINVLKGIAAGSEIEAVPLMELPAGDRLVLAPYRFRVRDGLHRFYGSIAAGFECLPATIVSAAKLRELSKNLGWDDSFN